MAKILFNGVTGQVGRAILHLSTQLPDHEWIGLATKDCDLTDAQQIRAIFAQHQPDYFIHAAAYTAVDKAETDKETCYAINHLASQIIGEEAKKTGTTVLYVSSDYVYHSITDRPILETDPCTPQGIYAKSKYQGEQAITEAGINHVILRTSWVYDAQGHNFVNTMLRLGPDRESLTIVNDQQGAPTYAPDIAAALINIIGKIEVSDEATSYNGIYNFANSGMTNWAEFAQQIFSMSNIPCEVKTQTTEEFGAPAPRPKWSVMGTEKYRSTFDASIRTWQDCLQECLSEKKMPNSVSKNTL